MLRVSTNIWFDLRGFLMTACILSVHESKKKGLLPFHYIYVVPSIYQDILESHQVSLVSFFLFCCTHYTPHKFSMILKSGLLAGHCSRVGKVWLVYFLEAILEQLLDVCLESPFSLESEIWILKSSGNQPSNYFLSFSECHDLI